MNNIVKEFFRRGAMASGFGPVVLAMVYLVLHQSGVIELLTVSEVCVGICSLVVLAFIAGGINVIYQLERLPLMFAITIHGVVLYVSYLLTYLVNGWLQWGIIPVLVFSGIFVVGYLVIWAIIYCVTKRNTSRINDALQKNRTEQ